MGFEVTNTFSNYTEADADEVNENFTDVEEQVDSIFLENAEQNIDIIRLMQDATLTPDTRSASFADIFVDATGCLNSVDTGATDSIYDSTDDFYKPKPSATPNTSTVFSEPSFETVADWTYSESDNHGTTSGGQTTDHPTEGTYDYNLNAKANDDGGYDCNANAYVTQTGVNFSIVARLTCDLYHDTDAGDVSTSSHIIYGGVSLYSLNHSTGTGTINIDVSDFTFTGTNEDFKLHTHASFQWNGNGDCHEYDWWDNIVTYGYGESDVVLDGISDSNATNVTKMMLTVKADVSTAATITADFSSDDGANYDTDVAFTDGGGGYWHTAMTSITTPGTHIKVKINMKDGVVQVYSYCLGWED